MDNIVIQITTSIANTTYDILIDGNLNHYNPTVVDDAILKLNELMRITFPTALASGYTFPTPQLDDDDDDEDDE